MPGNSDQRQASSEDRLRTDRSGRAFDVLLSASLLILAAPVILVIALASAASFRAWPIFCQERVGKDGKTFCCWKLRTLPTVVPSFTDKHDLANYHIPPFWRFVRSHHLDELPQLMLVLIGRMSMVGPRPEMEYLHDGMDPAFAALRTSVRPGCTGLWQVSKGSAELITATPEYDNFYVANRGLRLDAWIALQTVTVMLGITPRVALEDIPEWALPSDDVDERVVIDLRDLASDRLSVDAEVYR